MNPEVISPLFAIRFFESNAAEFLNSERKRSQEASSIMTKSAKKLKLQNIPENAELQITAGPSFCKKGESHLAKYDSIENLEDFSKNLHNVDISMNLLEPTAEVSVCRQLKQKMILIAVSRILKLEQYSLSRRYSFVKSKLSTLVTTTINPSIKKSVVKYITDKIQTRLHLGLNWLCKEYAIFREPQYHPVTGEKLEDKTITYATLFCILSTTILETNEEDRKILMKKLYMEVPEVPEEAMKCWKNIIPDERGLAILKLLQNLIIEKPRKMQKFLDILLYYSNHEMAIIRKGCVGITMDFYGNPIFTEVIVNHALLHVEYLRLNEPPLELFGEDKGRERPRADWTPSTVRACLALYIGLLEKQPHFIKELERLFLFLNTMVQRIVLKYIRIPLQTFKIASPLLDRSYIEKHVGYYDI